MQSVDDFVTVAREVLEDFKKNQSAPLWSVQSFFFLSLIQGTFMKAMI